MITEDQQPTSLQLYGMHLFMLFFKTEAHLRASVYMKFTGQYTRSGGSMV